jgi:hypothetical protein
MTLPLRRTMRRRRGTTARTHQRPAWEFARRRLELMVLWDDTKAPAKYGLYEQVADCLDRLGDSEEPAIETAQSLERQLRALGDATDG